MTTCPVCVSSINPENIKSCISCDFQCCLPCMKNYILNNGKEYIDCMNCKTRFNRSSLVSIFGNRFLQKGYVDYQKNILHKKYILTIPSIQTIAERYRHELIHDSISERVKHQIYTEASNTTCAKTYIGPCMTPDCVGYRDVNSFCGICNKTTCEDCLETKHNDHVCDESKRQSVSLINADCRECPRCHMRIFKIEGCSQMFCTRCNTVFDWRTGEIETQQRIHNPHYFEYLRTIHPGRDIPQNLGCNDHTIVMARLRSLLYITKKPNPDLYKKLHRLFQLYHSVYEYISKRKSDLMECQKKLLFAKLRHIIGIINTKELLTQIHQHTKSIEYYNETLQLLESLHNVIIDQLSGWIMNDPVDDNIQLREIENYIQYTNDSYVAMTRLYYTRKEYKPLILPTDWNGSTDVPDWID